MKQEINILNLLEEENPLKRKLGKMVFDSLLEYTNDEGVALAGILFLLKKYPENKFSQRVNRLVSAAQKFETVSQDCTEKESWEIRTKKLENFSQASFELKLILTVINNCLLELIIELHNFHGAKFWQVSFFFRRQVACYFWCFHLKIAVYFNHDVVNSFTATFHEAKEQLGWQRYYKMPI
jgi:hypothetical protein